MSGGWAPLLAVLLAALGEAYCLLCLFGSQSLAGVMLARGWSERGWTQERLQRRIRVLAVLGAAVFGVALIAAVVLALH